MVVLSLLAVVSCKYVIPPLQLDRIDSGNSRLWIWVRFGFPVSLHVVLTLLTGTCVDGLPGAGKCRHLRQTLLEELEGACIAAHASVHASVQVCSKSMT